MYHLSVHPGNVAVERMPGENRDCNTEDDCAASPAHRRRRGLQPRRPGYSRGDRRASSPHLAGRDPHLLYQVPPNATAKNANQAMLHSGSRKVLPDKRQHDRQRPAGVATTGMTSRTMRRSPVKFLARSRMMMTGRIRAPFRLRTGVPPPTHSHPRLDNSYRPRRHGWRAPVLRRRDLSVRNPFRRR